MADEDLNKGKQEGNVEVPMKLLTQMQEQMAELEQKVANAEAKNAGLEEMVNKAAEANDAATGEAKLRTKRDFTPKFRTVRLRKFSVDGNPANGKFVIGWTNRGAYQEVDRTGIAPQYVDFIDVIFLGDEKTQDNKIKAVKVRLLDLLNNGTQVHCKILEAKKEPKTVATNEEIEVSTFDPNHGLMATGETIDGYITHDEIKYKIQVPGFQEPVWIDATYANA